ncbi:MAG: hypothetical protein HY906_15965 [Deltaproteobacteria bacterium]|nr:hypothetical protein [Deltaproteobacteria bacterium]
MTAADTTDPVTLDFHTELYGRQAIDQAVASFAALGEFRVEVVGQYLRVTIRSGSAAALLGREFANHALSLAVVGAAGDEPDGDKASGAVDAT